ncbi:MAG: hypothetical protein BWY82_00621 [Verrucomicrobia bacterium ADurb.Bin474]|nr:MAG: hypothetical protein BWY82_00621 [Verrucomicrobia bacterium ADurb.Bin474]
MLNLKRCGVIERKRPHRIPRHIIRLVWLGHTKCGRYRVGQWSPSIVIPLMDRQQVVAGQQGNRSLAALFLIGRPSPDLDLT